MKKILIIDDDPTIRDVFNIFLILKGYSVFTAQSGEEGLQLFDRIRPDLVLTDVNMPGMDGLEVLQRIVARAPVAQVIVLTGMGNKLKEKAMGLGAADFLVKPISLICLNRAVKVVLKGAQGHCRLFSAFGSHPAETHKRPESLSRNSLLRTDDR